MDVNNFQPHSQHNLNKNTTHFDGHKALLTILGSFLLLIGVATFFQHKYSFISKLPFFSKNVDKDVLAVYDIVPYTQLQSNLKYVFNNSADVLNGMSIRGDVDADGSNFTLGEGTITAANIIYSLTAGDGINITGGQNPIISLEAPAATGVTSIESITGAVDLIAGTNISLSTDGNKITINSSGSSTDTNTTYTAGEGLALVDTTFSVDYNGIGLSDLGTSNTTSGASVIGVYSGNFTNIMVASPGTDLQTVLEAIDTELTTSGGGGIAAVGNISSGNAFTSGVPGSNLFVANTGWIGLGSGAGRIVWIDAGTDTISFMNTNVGIGLSNPSYTLDVAGNIRAGTDIYLGSVALGQTGGASVLGVNTSSITYSSASNIQQVLEDLDSAINNFGVGGSGPWLISGNYAYLNPSLATYLGNNASGGTNKLSGAYFSDGSLVSLGTDNDYRLVFDGNSLLLGDASNTFLSVGDSGTTGNFNFNNNQFYIRGDGNIGIGITNPVYALDIAGGLRVGGTAVFSTVPSISDNNSVLTLSSGVLSSINSTNWDKNGSDDLSTTTVFLGDVSGPYNNLQINPNTVDSSELVNTAVTVGSYGGVGGTAIYVPSFTVDADGRLTSASTTPFIAGTNFESPLTFTNGLTRTGNSIAFGGTLTGNTNLTLGSNNFTMMGAGSVGIGTTSITANMKLDVAGNIRAGTDVYIGNIALGGTGGASVIGFDDSGLIYVSATDVQNAIEDLDSTISSVASGTSVSWTDAGLYLYPTAGEYLGNNLLGGSNKLSGAYFSDGSLLSLGTDNDFRMLFNGTDFILGNTSNTFLSIGDSGTTGNFNFNNNQFYIRGDGNVGIGTTAPGAKLQVNGTTNATQFIVRANGTQSNTNGLIALQNSAGTTLLEIHTDDATNAFFGLNAGAANISNGSNLGVQNTFIGSGAGSGNLQDAANTALGYRALNAGGTGSYNTAIGTQAIETAEESMWNTAVGYGAYKTVRFGQNNVTLGVSALASAYSSYDNVAIGRNSLGLGDNTSIFNNNVAIGSGALYSAGGDGNVGIGYQAGYGAGSSNRLSLAHNVIIGNNAGLVIDTGANNNIFVGYQAADDVTSGANNIIIGYDINGITPTSSNTLNIGNLLFGTGLDGIGNTLSSGNISIGMTAATAGMRLDVAGNIRAGTDVYIGNIALGGTGGASILGFNDLNNSLTYVDASTIQNAIEDLDAAMATISGSAGLWTDGGSFLFPTGGDYLGNIALGGTGKLSGAYFSDNSLMSLGTDNDYRLLFDGNNLILGNTSSTYLSVGDSGTTGNFNFNNNQLYIRGDGKVGIGTTAPGEKFEISNNGEVYARIVNTLSTGAAGINLTSGNAYSIIFTNSQSQNEYGGANSLNLYGGPNSPIAFLVNDTPIPAMFITTTSNVGIGTTAPTANMTLDVAGNIRAGTDVYIGSIALGSTGGAGLIGVNTAGFTFTTAPTVQSQLSALNNGIGTTAYSSTNYVTSGATLGASIGTLDSAIRNLAIGNSGLWRDTNGATAGGNVYIGDTTSNLAIGGTNSNAPFYVSPVLGASINIGSTAAFTIGNTASDIFTFNTDINSGLDLFSLNVPSGTSNIANLFAIYDNGSPIFTVSQAQIESAVPHVFSAAGDVSIAYDLIFSNETSSNIKSNGPLTIESGEVFENNDLTFRTFGSGNIILETNTGNLKVAGGSIIGGTYMSLGMTSPLNGLLVEGRVAIGATAPTANMALDVVGNIRAGTDVYIGNIRLGATGTTNLTSGAGKIGIFNEFSYIGVGSSTVQDGLDDLDAAIGNLIIGSSGLWLDGGNYTYLNSAFTNGIIGNTVPGGANKISGLFLTDTAPVWFGLDNDFRMQFNTTNLSIGDSSNNFLTIADAGILGTVAINTDDLYVSGTNSRVGIGTATPLGVLDVRGDIFTDRWLLSATNTGVGSSVYGGGALSHTTANEGWYNTAFGANALYANTTGFMNTAIGQQSGYQNTTGDSNVAIGHQSLVFNQSGDHNVAIGVISGYGVSTNSYSDNTLIGYSTGYSLSSSTGRNTLIGSQAGDQITSGTGNIVIGYNIDAPSATGNNQLNIGGLLMGTLGVGATINGNAVLGSSGSSAHTILGTVTAATLYTTTVGVTNRDLFVDNTGVVGYVSSSQRYKEDINYLNDVDWLYNLKPVNYVYKNDPTNGLQYGLIAEEVDKINPLLVSYNDQGLPETVSYSKLITPLLKAVQDQRSTLASLSNDFATLALPEVDSFVNVDEFAGLETEFNKLEETQLTQQSEIIAVQSQVQDLMNRIDLAEPIASEESKVDNLADRVSFLEQMLFGKEASISAELAELINNTDEYPDGEVLGIQDGKLTVEDLTVTGKTNLFDLGVVGDMSVGQIVVRGNESAINSLALPLQIQSEGTAPIELMAGKVVIDTEGNVTVKQEVTAKKYNVDTKDKESSSIGKGILKAGETEVIIKSTSVTGESNIFLTPTVESDVPLAVVEKIAGKSFKVKVIKESDEDISFNWWIVN